MSQRKVELASTSYETVDKYIIDLDKSYLSFTQNAALSGPASRTEPAGPQKAGRKKKQKAVEAVETDGTVESMGEQLMHHDAHCVFAF